MQPNHSTRSLRLRLRDEDGIALIVALMAMMLMMALGIVLVMTTTTETKISANYRDGTEALYAADAAVERVMDDILTVPDWNSILSGARTSAFVDGSAGGVRTLADGSKLDLTEATQMLRCGKVTTCSDADMNALTDERPWGANNPRWQLYAYGPLKNMTPTATIDSPMYVVVWVADDPAENDGNPLQDGTLNTNPGRGVMSMIAQGFGPGGTRRTVEITVSRTDSTEIERGYIGQRGQDEQNRRARKAAVQTPGKTLTRAEMNIGTGGLATQATPQ